MPNFQAKTREELRDTPATPPPVEELPGVDMSAFGFCGDAGSALHRHFVYATRTHTLADILRRGYFGAARRVNDIREFGVKEWDTICVTIGDDPATAIEVDLRVVSIGTGRSEPIVLAQGEVRGFTVPGMLKGRAA